MICFEAVQKWNLLDKTIFSVEEAVKKIIDKTVELTESDEADVEMMINAATEHLQKENRRLSSFQFPEQILKKNGKYHCPKCQLQIAAQLINQYHIKYCPGCGQRFKNEKVNSNDCIK